MGELLKLLNNLLMTGTAWLSAAAHPVEELMALAQCTSNEIAVRLARVGIASYTLTLCLYAPLLHVFGIDIGNVGYVVSNMLAISLMYAVLVICLHVSLKLRGQESDLLRTSAFYAMPNVTYFPVTALLGTPATFRLYSLISHAKGQHLSLISTLQYLRSEYASFQLETNFTIITWLTYLSLISLVVSALCVVLSSEALVQFYNNDRSRTYIAATDGVLVGIVFAVLTAGPFYCFVAYAFVSAS
jgi:hypothetical protein